MDLSSGSIGWHRARRFLDEEINRERPAPSEEYPQWAVGMDRGSVLAYMKVRTWFNTPEENEEMERLRREMFNG